MPPPCLGRRLRHGPRTRPAVLPPTATRPPRAGWAASGAVAVLVVARGGLALVRAARRQAEVELRGVSGCLDLPEGAGELWPLLAAAMWLHLGKGTTLGLGELQVLPLLN